MGKLATLLPASLALTIVACFICAFGTKGGMMPFHSWLPDAHSEAPAPISALLSGLVITIGPFGFARTVALFSPHYSPGRACSSPASACASIVLGILMAIAQDDLKRLLAYSSISQIGYVFVGIGLGTYLGIYGGLFHAVTHLLAKSAALLLLGRDHLPARHPARSRTSAGCRARCRSPPFCFFVGAPVDRRPAAPRRVPEQVHDRPRPGRSRSLWWALAVAAARGDC